MIGVADAHNDVPESDETDNVLVGGQVIVN